MTSCESMIGLILRSLDDTLDTEGREHLAAHLAGCPACRRAAAEQRAVAEALGRLTFEPVSDDFAARVRQRIMPPPWLDVANWRMWTLRLAPVAALLAVLAWLPLERDESQAQSLSAALESWAKGSARDSNVELLLTPGADANALLAAAIEDSTQ